MAGRFSCVCAAAYYEHKVVVELLTTDNAKQEPRARACDRMTPGLEILKKTRDAVS